MTDVAYAGKNLRGLQEKITWTTRLRKDAALFDLAPVGLDNAGLAMRPGSIR